MQGWGANTEWPDCQACATTHPALLLSPRSLGCTICYSNHWPRVCFNFNHSRSSNTSFCYNNDEMHRNLTLVYINYLW